MKDRVGEIWMYLTTSEVFFVVDSPRLLEEQPHEVVLHGAVILNGGFSKSPASGHKEWYERTYKEWGTIASHMRRVA